MRRHLSRRQSISLGVIGALSALAWSCGGDDSSPTGGTGGTGGSTGGGATGGSSGSGGASGSGGSTGGAGGSGGTGGSGGASGSGGTTGGASGSGGSSGGSGGKDAGTAKDSGTGDGSNIGCGMAVVALISLNHPTPHALTIPPEDITAAQDKVYNARGQSSHDHFVQLTAADFATLKAGGTVIKKSCNSNDHEFVFSCAPPSRQPATPTCADECGATMTNFCPS